MELHLATDHAGYHMKEDIKLWLLEGGYTIVDHGARELDIHDDYPDYIHALAKNISNNPKDKRGIIFGGSGQGEAMVANRYPEIRAVVYYGGRMPQGDLEQEGTHATDELDFIRLSRRHNDANVLSIGARFVSVDEVKGAITAWLETDFSHDDRHVRRLSKIDTNKE